MKTVVFGSAGQLGRELVRASWPSEVEPVFFTRAQQDIADATGVGALLERLRPGFVINAGAYTAVDAAESDEVACMRANRDGPRVLAEACGRIGAALVHVSTDFVFDGAQSEPYTEDAPTAPLGVYGRSKLEGERAVRDALVEHLVVRTSWVYGALGNSFVSAMLRLAQQRDELRVVADQVGRPTSAAELARALLSMLSAARAKPGSWGVYHFADRGSVSRYELARYVIALQAAATGRSPRIEPIPSSAYPTPARRPLNSVLDTHKLEATFGIQPRPWQQGVERVVRELLAAGS